MGVPPRADRPTPLKRPLNWENLSAADAERVVRERAEDSGKVFFGNHAWDRIGERSITRADALTILRKGYVEGKPQRTDKGEWKVTMTRRLNRSRSAGVVTIILKSDALFVKTVMWMD
jgi:hypothetical protein